MSGQCAECGRVSLTSPSEYFCSDICQQRWYAKQTVGYPLVSEVQEPAEPAREARRWRAA
ncbi:MAG TPA: hypothetical protein VF444_22805 [Pseudonocardiaceae bacterium]